MRIMKGRKRSGQAALEYVLAMASMQVVTGILWVFARAAVHHAERTESLVTADCP